jgi:hypothetical protein
MEALRCYTSTGDCRHASLVNFFQPGALNTQGPCEGGCDNCKRRFVCSVMLLKDAAVFVASAQLTASHSQLSSVWWLTADRMLLCVLCVPAGSLLPLGQKPAPTSLSRHACWSQL